MVGLLMHHFDWRVARPVIARCSLPRKPNGGIVHPESRFEARGVARRVEGSVQPAAGLEITALQQERGDRPSTIGRPLQRGFLKHFGVPDTSKQ